MTDRATKKKIRVCHMTSTHFPKDQRIFVKECISLVKAGYDVSLVERGESEECEGVHIVGTGEMNAGRYYRLLIRPRTVYRLARQLDADVYHFHDMELLPYGVKLKKEGKKVIFDCHEDYMSRFADSDALPFPMIIKKILAALYAWYEKNCLKKFDALIAVTPITKERLEKSNPNSYLVTNYPITGEGWAQYKQYNALSDYIAFAGIVDKCYNLDVITQAIQDVAGITLKVCGPLRKHDSLKLITQYDNNHKAVYLGVIPYMEVAPFFRNARASVVLYAKCANSQGDYGSLGCNKLFESMMCGVPVICTDFVLWKEIIAKYHCGICVDPYSKKGIRDALIWIRDHPEEAAEMGANGRKAAMEEFNWGTQEKVLYKLYETVCFK